MSDPKTTLEYDAVLVPGGGFRDRSLPPWVKNRLDRAFAVCRECKHIIITLSAGTTHKPLPTDDEGFPIFESVAAANYLISLNFPPRRILCEISSYDTIGNAYFSRMIHAEPLVLKKLLVITSEFHMPRTKAIFKWIYGLPLPNSLNEYKLDFEAVPDINTGLDEETITARSLKEKAGLERVQRQSRQMRNIRDFHHWMYTRHGAYAMSTKPVRLKGKILSTY